MAWEEVIPALALVLRYVFFSVLPLLQTVKSQLCVVCSVLFRLQAKKRTEPWGLLLKAKPVTIRLVSLLTDTSQLIWTIQARKCFILYLQALDRASTSVQSREQHLSSQMTSGTAYLLAQIQVQCHCYISVSFCSWTVKFGFIIGFQPKTSWW